MIGLDGVAARANYLLGNNPGDWVREVPLFGRVRAEGAYPGIDVIYYTDPVGRLEYDFVVSPGADPGQISLRIEGADAVRVDENGDLVLKVGGEEVRQHRPVIYQERDGNRQPVKGGYELRASGSVGFALADYDRQQTLVIDPVLSFSTFLGGSKSDLGWGIALDAAGNIFVAGETLSKVLMATNGVYQPSYAGGIQQFGDAFVAKYDPSGSNLLFLTYLGGKTDDAALALALDADGNPVITGFTDSRDFPVVPADLALRNQITGPSNNAFRVQPVDAYVTKLSSDGSQVIFSTLLGGGGRDSGNRIVVDASGIYVAGLTESTNFFPAPNGYQTNFGGDGDAFLIKLTDATSYTYCTFLGGTNLDYATGLAVDPAGNAYLTGSTTSTNFPLVNPLIISQGTNVVTCNRLNGRDRFVNRSDAFVSAVSADGASLLYSSFLGGLNLDEGIDIAVDGAGVAVVTGNTASWDFPTNVVNLAGQRVFARHVFAARIGPGGGSNVLYSTQFGGGRLDESRAIALDAAGNAYIAGITSSRDFFGTNIFTDLRPMTGGKRRRSASDGFVAVLSPNGSSLVGTNSVLTGGVGIDQPNDLLVNPAGTVIHLVGQTTSKDFPLVGAPQTRLGNVKKSRLNDAFVQRIELP